MASLSPVKVPITIFFGDFETSSEILDKPTKGVSFLPIQEPTQTQLQKTQNDCSFPPVDNYGHPLHVPRQWLNAVIVTDNIQRRYLQGHNQEYLVHAIRTFSQFSSWAQKSPLSSLLTAQELDRICSYVQTNLFQLIHLATATQTTLYLRPRHTGLSRAIQVTPEGNMYIHFNRAKMGDLVFGAGTYKRVTAAVHLLTGHVFASISIQEFEDTETSKFSFVKGLSSCLQLIEKPAIYPRTRAQLGKKFDRSVIDQIIRHPNYCKVRYLTELCLGGSLYHVINHWKPNIHPNRITYARLSGIGNLQDVQNRFSSIEFHSRTCKQLLRALVELYREGLIHRDIKPANILIKILPTGETFAKFADFGSLIRQRQDTDRHRHFTTCGYVSPQYAKSMLNKHPIPLKDTQTHELDVWSLGITFLEFLTGHLEWVQYQDLEKASFLRIAGLQQERLRKLIMRSNIPRDYPDILPFIQGMLRIDPVERMAFLRKLSKNPEFSSSVS